MKIMRRFLGKVVMCLLLLCPAVVVGRDLLIGDSHAGGVKWACPSAPVWYKNGTTTDWWLKQSPRKVEHLFIITGTNDSNKSATPAKQKKLCDKWNPSKCTVVHLPKAPTRDGVHYYLNTYRTICKNIFY